MADADPDQRVGDHRVEPVALGDGVDDLGHGDVVPALSALAGQRATRVGRAGADGELVRRAAVLHFVDREQALFDEPFVLPAERHVQLDAAWGGGQGDGVVVVGQCQVELVGVHAASFAQCERDEAAVDLGGGMSSPASVMR